MSLMLWIAGADVWGGSMEAEIGADFESGILFGTMDAKPQESDSTTEASVRLDPFTGHCTVVAPMEAWSEAGVRLKTANLIGADLFSFDRPAQMAIEGEADFSGTVALRPAPTGVWAGAWVPRVPGSRNQSAVPSVGRWRVERIQLLRERFDRAGPPWTQPLGPTAELDELSSETIDPDGVCVISVRTSTTEG